MSEFQQQLTEADEQQIQRLANDPRLYIRNAWPHPNDRSRRYDFRTTDGSERLDYLLDDDGPLNPDGWGGINILLMARGLLKSTTLQMILNWCFQFYGPLGFEAYMGTPREGQRDEFVEKFKDKVRWSGMDRYRSKNALGHQKFTFPKDDGPDVTAHFKSDTGWGGGDAMRGPHSHVGIFDEFQDATPQAFNAGFYEVIDQSIQGVPYFPTIFIMGTPKMEGSFFEDMWQRSDQREWDPSRGDSGEWVKQSDATVYGSGDDAMDVVGWHVDQPTVPLHSKSDIEAKRDLKTEQEFQNEVLAQFYSPEDHLLSERHLDAICDPNMPFVNQPRDTDNFITVGIDWGGGSDRKAADTVMAIMEHIEYEDGTTESILDNIHFLDESLSKDDEFKRLEEQILRFDPELVVVDEGYGAKAREDLQEGNHTMDTDGYDIVKGCRFGNISNTSKIKWKDESAKQLFTADKTHVAKSFVDFVKAERLTVPAANLDASAHGRDDATGTRLYRHMTAPYEQRRETRSGRKKATITADGADNDDAFDACVYAWIGYHADKLGPTNTPIRFHTSRVPGA